MSGVVNVGVVNVAQSMMTDFMNMYICPNHDHGVLFSQRLADILLVISLIHRGLNDSSNQFKNAMSYANPALL